MSSGSTIFLLIYSFTSKLLSYLLMLLIMTFNGWVFITIVLGLTLGYSIK